MAEPEDIEERVAEISLPGGPDLPGLLSVPREANALVIFAHGSGSSRLSPRNRLVAESLVRAGIGTLLFDLLTELEDARYRTRFDIDLLTSRLVAATEWVRGRPEARRCGVAYFGTSTGAAAALAAAARLGDEIQAVVSRGGRPDLAMPVLDRVRAPTLLIVGGADSGVIDRNQAALERLPCPKRLVLIPGATHLFDERGALEEVARLATEWFLEHARPRSSAGDRR